MTARADRTVDALYQGLRGRFGGTGPGANGYVTAGFFRREQRVLLALVVATAAGRDDPPVILDIACGSGLMLGDATARARLPAGTRVLGLDFNARACRDAAANGVRIARGDAFRLPFADGALSHAVNCQFLNQQTAAARAPFLAEAHRVLAPGGHLILLWRKADSWPHRAVNALLSARDRRAGRPVFPQVDHPMAALIAEAEATGFRVARAGVTLPVAPRPGGAAPVLGARSPLARPLGASNLLVLRKAAPGGAP
ncbi:class I SAM-dependent methyltransferase [Marivibrio halodurans]|uniref:Class I SAM-dependent methyltransferase n=1 Tax=Marivibrio halodurans TaxID=2039722 RepID=A0A8J7S1J2_9PROT|nr:class I SAM-dependent methyltransferase [Marivibrio halodurans]MBP5858647.1 class I SAM-dependent methyltransferase [Marivibrio halodurans]